MRFFKSSLLKSISQSTLFRHSRHQNTAWKEWRPSLDHYHIPGLKPSLSEKFVPQSFTKGTQNFVHSNPPHTYLQQLLKSFLTSYLGYSHINASATLGMYKMFVLDADITSSLLRDDFSNGPRGTLLDVGAGDGAVTSELSEMFEYVCATEASSACYQSLLQNPCIDEAFFCADLSALIKKGKKFDVVTLFNVLDRCNKPTSLLRETRHCMAENGKLLVAMVYPFKPFVVEKDLLKQHPDEDIFSSKTVPDSFADFCHHAVENVFLPNGFELDGFTRVPYICMSNESDETPFVCLNCAIFCLR